MSPQNTDTSTRRHDPLWGLLPHLAEHRLALAWTGVVGIANNLALVFLAVAGSYAVTLALVEGRLAPGGWWIAGAAAVLLRAVLTWHEMDLSHSIAYRVLAALRMGLFDGFSRGVPSRTPGQHTGRLAATAMGDTEKLEFFYAHTLTQLAGALVLLAGGTATLYRIGGTLAAGWLLGLAALVLLTLPWLRSNARLGQEVQRAKSDQSALAVDLLAGSREILGFGLQEQVQRQLAAATRTVARAERRLKARESAAASVRELCSLGILVVVFLAAWNQPGLDRLWIPAVVAGTLTLLSPLMEAVAVLTQLQPHRAGAARVLEGISMPAEGARATAPVAFAADGPLGLEVDGASFSYRDGAPALEPTWLSVAPGEHLGISGSSGSGKTTLARLLVRLWSPDAGSIALVPRTGVPVDVASIEEHDFRSLVTLVEQDATIFHGSLLENMRLAVPGATAAEAGEALRRAGLHLEPGRWPAGVHSMVGETGSGVSGGERARIALARALLLRPRVLVLDETTASLDAATEALLLDAVAALAGDTTVITISHRESTLARCDRRVALAGLQSAPLAQPA
ncbi:ABC transporter ATP-binding protein/permease [Paeniglutamicibacter sp. ABSL32-1]|uniref:ATP-binding cassette domain-containing protein n=1 Tax=Paeniglutamicibacter quisquiliarum TaxID=2849498 RepID=UPI001C2D0E00|nr:ABC transporter ATP-binding protein [Paeniglutamicibacter quisquiliarum]MBV1778773.1 ABC transporter ATP-binding protein/permease [Paeniglutamicibacter quisquiliarum]